MVTRKGGRRGRSDPRQLPIDWAADDTPEAVTARADTPQVPEPRATPSAVAADPVAADPVTAGPALLVERLPWDFAATFPPPLPEAVEAGTVDEGDASEPAALHQAYAEQMRAALVQLDAAADAARRKVDPGKAPRSHAARERLDRYPAAEPARLSRWFDTLVGTYEASFGNDAAEAFARAVRARHAGVEVVADGRGDRPSTAEPPSMVPHVRSTARHAVQVPPAPAIAAGGEAVRGPSRRKALERRPRPPEVGPRLRVPKPLPEAVAAGRFGRDEQGHVVHPDADEVWAITQPTIEAVVERVAELVGAERRGMAAAEVARRQAQIRADVQDYAEDFGQAAAERLLAYAYASARWDGPTRPSGRGR